MKTKIKRFAEEKNREEEEEEKMGEKRTNVVHLNCVAFLAGRWNIGFRVSDLSRSTSHEL